jgi:hypothetical protein
MGRADSRRLDGVRYFVTANHVLQDHPRSYISATMVPRRASLAVLLSKRVTTSLPCDVDGASSIYRPIPNAHRARFPSSTVCARTPVCGNYVEENTAQRAG